MPRVLVPLAPGCEEMEAVTIIDILRRAKIEVAAAGLADGPVEASRGVMLLPDTTLDAVLDKDFDMIVLPGGGPGADALARDKRIAALLKKAHDAGKYIAAICAAPKVLAQAGLLEGRRATAYPGVLEPAAHPGIQLVSEAVVRDGAVITGRGPGAAIDFALELVELLAGAPARQQVEAALVRN